MKIFLDTANKTLIEKYSTSGLIDGVTTNPTHLSKERVNITDHIKDICHLLPAGEVSVEITERDPKKAYIQAKAIAALCENIIVKIPCHKDYYPIIEQLTKEGIKLNITLVFTVLQGFMMAKLGVHYISPFVGRWDDVDVQAHSLLSDLCHMKNIYDYQTGILAASIRQLSHFNNALIAGCDAITLPPALFERAIENTLTNDGIVQFEADWRILKIDNFPE